MLDLLDGDHISALGGIDDKSSRVGKLWIRVTFIFGDTGVDND